MQLSQTNGMYGTPTGKKWDDFGRFWTTFLRLPFSSCAFRTMFGGKITAFGRFSKVTKKGMFHCVMN